MDNSDWEESITSKELYIEKANNNELMLNDQSYNMNATESKSVLDQLHSKQQERTKKLFNPLSEPTESMGTRSSSFHHNQNTDRSQIVNSRNKHTKIQQFREKHRQDKLNFNREKIHERQSYSFYLAKCELESESLIDAVGLDTLIEEERDLPRECQQVDVCEIELDTILKMLDLSDN